MQNYRLPLAALGLVLFAATLAPADETARIRERELSEVRSRIEALRESIADKSRKRNKIDAELQATEADLKAARERLAKVESSQRENRERLAAIETDSAARRRELASETEQLVRQLRAAYTSGRTERVRLLLNQSSPADLGRTLTYYRYLNEFRQDNIDTVEQRLAELSGLRERELRVRRELDSLHAAEKKELEQRDRLRAERQTLVSSLDAQIAREGGEVAELRQQEADLERLILELSSILADYPITSEQPFSALKGKLTWPIAGRLIADFGQPRGGTELKWNGVVLGAARGHEVRALYHGRVAFADWLPGLGLLLVLDHGEGYLSLYGHNDSLLKDVGNWVAAGDVVATVGDSGGQVTPGLYLEIRQGRKPLNPRHWISRQPRER